MKDTQFITGKRMGACCLCVKAWRMERRVSGDSSESYDKHCCQRCTFLTNVRKQKLWNYYT